VNTIPIVWGDPPVKEFFNPESFICRDDFSSDNELAEYVLHVDNTPELYAKYIQAPPFYKNVPNSACGIDMLLSFFDQIFRYPIRPVSQRAGFLDSRNGA